MRSPTKAQDAAIKQLQSDMMALKKDVLMVDMKASEKTDAGDYRQFRQWTDRSIQQGERDA